MKRPVIIFMAILSLFSSARAGSKKEDNFEFTHHRASISGMLTSSCSWQVELGYHYMLNRYVGLGGSIGAWQVYFEEGMASGSNWQVESDDNRPWNIYLRPSVILKSPALSVKHVNLGIFAEPGLMLNIPYARVWVRQDTRWPEYDLKPVSTTKGQWLGVDLRLGVYVNIGPCGFMAGYMMSNLDVYSRYRQMSYRGTSFRDFYPRKSFMQGACLTASYYF